MDQPDEHQLLEQFLSERDESCPCCEYNLRTLKGNRCPECGDVLRLRVGLEQPRRASFITGLVALSAAMGFSGLLLLYFFIRIGISGGKGGILPFLYITSSECVVSTILFVIWLRSARRIRLLDPFKQWLLVSISVLVPIASLVIFALLIR